MDGKTIVAKRRDVQRELRSAIRRRTKLDEKIERLLNKLAALRDEEGKLP